jgi:SPP1 gp7 family putative phage head morphogenesis protein
VGKRITQFAAEKHLAGARQGEIEKEIRRYAPHLVKSKVQLIARTQLGRAELDLTRTRSEQLGLEYFVWQTSDDSRVRKSHRNMNNVVVPWGNLPSPEALVGEKNYGTYGPGGTFNCRCLAEPLADLAEVQWPARVYVGNQIQRMTLAKFKRLPGVIRIAA